MYFLIVLIGFFLLGYVYPKMYHQPYFTFSIPQGILLYVFFLPNYAAKNFIVGILNPLWSIGVEEQFYLFWAPIVKWFKGYLKLIIAFFVVITILFYGIVYYKLINIPDNIERFLLTQKFYAMAIGSAFGYVLYFQLYKYNTSFFASKAMQVIVLFVILYHFLIGFSFSEYFVFKITLAVLYGLLILNVAAIKNKIITLQNSTLSYLGVISYGIYMYHMLVDYFLRIVVQKTVFLHVPVTVIVVMYYLLLLAITIFIASFSYTYFEKYFLIIKNKMQRSNLPATA